MKLFLPFSKSFWYINLIVLLSSILWINLNIIFAEDTLEADVLTYDESTQILTATGNVKYSDKSYEVLANYLQYDSENEVLTANEVSSISIANFNKNGQTATLYAEQIVYEKNKESFTATGKVRLLFDDNIFQGDSLKYNKNQNKLKMESHVKLHTNDNKNIDGDLFEYDINKKEGLVDNFAYNFVSQGTNYFSHGKSLIYNEQETTIYSAQVTTCDEDAPHYHFFADKMVHYPKKEIAIYNGSYWHGTHKLFQASKTVIGLYNDEPVLPTAGYSKDEGWYIKTKDYYNLSGKDYRVIHKDILSKRGIGIGLREYRFGEDTEYKESSLYGAYNPFDSNIYLKGDWSSFQKGHEQMLSFESKKDPLTDRRQFWANWSLLAGSQNTQTIANINYYAISGTGKYSYLGGDIYQAIKNTKELRTYWNYNASTSLLKNSQKYNDRAYSLRMEYTKPLYIANLSFTENKYGLDYLPKLTLQTTLPSSFQFGLSAANVSQNYSDIKVWQNTFTTEYRSKTKKIQKNTFLMMTALGNYTLFSDKYSMNDYKLNTTLVKNISPKYYLSASAFWEQARGFDSIIRKSANKDTRKINLETNYVLNENYRVGVGLSHDFANNNSDSIIVNLDGRTYPFWNWNLSTEYDIKSNYFKTTEVSFTFNQDSGVTGYVKLKYDAQINSITEAMVRLEGKMGKNWSYSIRSDYFTQGQTINISEIELVRNLHCQDIVFSVYPHDKVYLVALKLKDALPKTSKKD